MTAKFNGITYTIQFTDHARIRMIERKISESQVAVIIQSGQVRPKPKAAAFWVFANVEGRSDNSLCISLVIESTDLVIKTVLVNWRPK